MSAKTKQTITQVVIFLLLLSTLVFGILTFTSYKKISRLNNQIENLKEINDNNKDVEDYVILTFVNNEEGVYESFNVDKELEISIYDFLLTTKLFEDDDFDSFDGENFFFKNKITDVLELKEDEDYYETDEWGSFLTVGLNKVILTRDYTVVMSSFE